MKTAYTHEMLLENPKKRAKFFEGLQLIINDLKKHGFREAAKIQIDNRDEMMAYYEKYGD